MIINVYCQIGYQEGFPILFQDSYTPNPIVTEDLNPNYAGEELLVFIG